MTITFTPNAYARQKFSNLVGVHYYGEQLMPLLKKALGEKDFEETANFLLSNTKNKDVQTVSIWNNPKETDIRQQDIRVIGILKNSGPV